LLLGIQQDVDDIADAIEKIRSNADELLVGKSSAKA
jgi:hypothetical protein